jgi:alkylated DNA repair dioxygenase AlkB
MHSTHKFALGNAEWFYQDNYLSNTEEKNMINHLEEQDFIRGDYMGRPIMRSQKWYHNSYAYFNDKWPVFDRWKACIYTPEIRDIQDKIAKKYSKVGINSTLINKYDGNDIIPAHRDSEIVFGDNPTIIIVSLGSTRILRFKRVSPDTSSLKVIGEIYDVVLKPRSLFIMSGTTQKYFCHEILPQEAEDETIRYSMTFRKHVTI